MHVYCAFHCIRIQSERGEDLTLAEQQGGKLFH